MLMINTQLRMTQLNLTIKKAHFHIHILFLSLFSHSRIRSPTHLNNKNKESLKGKATMITTAKYEITHHPTVSN